MSDYDPFAGFKNEAVAGTVGNSGSNCASENQVGILTTGGIREYAPWFGELTKQATNPNGQCLGDILDAKIRGLKREIERLEGIKKRLALLLETNQADIREALLYL